MAPRQNLKEKGILGAASLMLNKTSVKPSTRVAPGFILLKVNSTSSNLMINTTGTTWMYLYTTSTFGTK